MFSCSHKPKDLMDLDPLAPILGIEAKFQLSFSVPGLPEATTEPLTIREDSTTWATLPMTGVHYEPKTVEGSRRRREVLRKRQELAERMARLIASNFLKILEENDRQAVAAATRKPKLP